MADPAVRGRTARSVARTAAGVFRIVHPFPSALNAVLTAALVVIAGGTPMLAARLGIAMFALQAAIGTANDLVDEPVDAVHKSTKPLPRGLITRGAARMLLAVALALGLGLSALSGPAVFTVALTGTGIGLAYDRWLKGTVWSWLPFALGIPLLPVYAWLGAAGRIPGSFLVLIPTAMVAGAALALANLLADHERDRAAGAVTAATRLGAGRAWLICALLQAIVFVVALGSLVALQGRGGGVVAAAAGGIVMAAGLAIGRSGRPGRREVAWETQAVGLGLLAAGWVAALAEAGRL